jgi:hypothetical protein
MSIIFVSKISGEHRHIKKQRWYHTYKISIDRKAALKRTECSISSEADSVGQIPLRAPAYVFKSRARLAAIIGVSAHQCNRWPARFEDEAPCADLRPDALDLMRSLEIEFAPIAISLRAFASFW